MKKALVVLSTVLPLLAGAALAQDPPKAPAPPVAAKHENKISPEAKAAFEKMAKAVNGPLQKGVKEATGTVVVEGPQGAMTFKFTVKDGAVSVESAAPAGGGPGGGGGGGGRGGMGGGARMWSRQIEGYMGYALGVFNPSDDVEHDATVETKDGKEVVAVVHFRGGEPTERRELSTNADGLVASAVITRSGIKGGGGDPMKRAEQVNNATYSWTKSGDAWRLDKVEIKSSGATTTVALVHLDVAGSAFPASWTMTMSAGASVKSKVTELTVDGKKVEIKDEAKPADAGK
jgi:hypothetical protein